MLSKHQGQNVFSITHSAHLSLMVNRTAGTMSASRTRAGASDQARDGWAPQSATPRISA